MAKLTYAQLLKKAQADSAPNEIQIELWRKSMVIICNSLGLDLQEVELNGDLAVDLVEAMIIESPQFNPADYEIVKGIKPPEDANRIGKVIIGKLPNTFNVDVVIEGVGFCVYVYPTPFGGNQRGE
jgi:hypothetical protein